MRTCLNCGKELVKYQQKYCSHNCQLSFQRKEYITRWKNSEESGLRGQKDLSVHVREYLLEKFNHRCQKCGWGEINPTTGRIPLEIHHIDGDYRNCAENNLEVLCPNCHSLTPNFGSLNKEGRGETNTRKCYCVDCGKPITNGATRCSECERKNRITEKPATREELKALIRSTPFTTIGENFGVSDNAIRKWCVGYGLPTRKKDIKEYSDEEWDKL